MAQRIEQVVGDYPGLHLREIARQLDTSVALIEYHVPALERDARVEVQRSDGFVRLFPRPGDGDTADRDWLVALRERNGLQIALALLSADGPLRHKELVEQLAVGKSRLTFHLKKLIAAGVVEKTPDGFTLVDAPRVGRLLNDHRPTPDLRDRLADLWGAFYGG